MSLLWDVVDREEPILLRQLLGKIEVYVAGTVKLECKNKEGESVVLNLYNTLYIPQANVFIFSLQKMREAHYRIVQPQPIGTDWIQSEEGLFIGSMCGPGGQGSCKLQNPPTSSQSLHSDSVACEGDRGGISDRSR